MRREGGAEGGIASPEMPKNTFLTKNATNFFILQPRILLGRLAATIQGSGLPPPQEE